MNGTKRRRASKRNQGSITVALGQGLRRHLTTRVGWYVPAVVPLVLFFLVHLLTLIAFILIRYELVPQDPVVYKAAVTWAVYGFIPLLLSSYCCFFALARPGITFLARHFSQWSLSNLHLANGCVYGIGMGLALLVMLQPGIGLKSLILFLIGLASGLGTWQLYRRLAAVDPLAGRQQADQPLTDEIVEE